MAEVVQGVQSVRDHVAQILHTDLDETFREFLAHAELGCVSISCELIGSRVEVHDEGERLVHRSPEGLCEED